jgi:C-terminal processing protease CtpA/Prc
LVIDIRNNTGGNFKKVRKLLIPGLKKRPNVCSPGHLFVLTGPVTFSAAMTNAVDLRRECNAILVGEPTGARPNQYQEGRSFLLPSSKLRVTVSTRYYAFQEEDTPGVIPDHHIMQSWQDHREGIDPVLEWVVAQ